MVLRPKKRVTAFAGFSLGILLPGLATHANPYKAAKKRQCADESDESRGVRDKVRQVQYGDAAKS